MSRLAPFQSSFFRPVPVKNRGWKACKPGADDYLMKPFSARELLARVSGRLEIARLQRDRESQLRISQAELEQRVQERTQELVKASQELRELSARILQAQDEERRRIARELHDGAGQLLAALGMEASKLPGKATG